MVSTTSTDKDEWDISHGMPLLECHLTLPDLWAMHILYLLMDYMSQYISLSVTNQEDIMNTYKRDTANLEKETTESIRAISLKFVSSQKGNYLKERLYSKIYTWVLESILKSWSCQKVVKNFKLNSQK